MKCTLNFDVTGMSCAACASRIEKSVSKISGIEECAVNLLTNSMTTKGNVDADKIIRAVEKAGYGASLKKQENLKEQFYLKNKSKSKQKSETTPLVKRLIFSSIFLLILMYFSMAHSMWAAPLPHFFDENHIAIALVQMLLAAIIMLINKNFFVSGFKSAIHLAPNMDTLVALGSGVSFLYSLAMLFKMTNAIALGNNEKVMECMHNLYFESAAMIVTLITVGKLLESISKGKTTDALKNLIKLAPKTAIILKKDATGEEKEIIVEIENVKVGDIFVLRPGDRVPVDGIVVEGNSALDESMLTGESLPVDKKTGDEVSAGTINTSGFLKCRAEKIGQDTTLSKIIQMISDSASTKAPIARIADKVSLVFVPSVMAISLVTFIVWLILGKDFSFALSRAIAVLVVSCPCALGLATPVAIMVGNGVGAKNGILFKNSESLENAGKIKNILFDKTGTITNGNLEVVDVINLKNDCYDKSTILKIAASLESKSSHPIAKAILNEAKKNAHKNDKNYENDDDFKILESQDFLSHAGRGVEGVIGENRFFVGKPDFITFDAPISKMIEELSKDGKTIVIVSSVASSASIENSTSSSSSASAERTLEKNPTVIALITLSDTVKPESKVAISELHNMKINTALLTGDNEKTANSIAKQVGIDKVISNVLPDEKEKTVATFMKNGKTAMVGDGINDAPAIMKADIGIAIGSGSDVALDCADIVLMKNHLDDVAFAIKLSRRTLFNIKENLFWAFFYNVALIPVAAGCYSSFGLVLNPMLAAGAMSLSSFCVVMNALRLNWVKKRGTGSCTRSCAENDVCAENGTENDTKSGARSGTENDVYAKNGSKKLKIGTHINSKIQKKEVNKMEKTVKVEGMMCSHCEKRVKEALEKIRGVESALANHETGEVKLVLSKEVKEKLIEKAITDSGYKFLEAINL